MRKRFGLHKHASASKIREVMGSAHFDGFRSFAIVRNPFSRLQSSYHFLKNWGHFSGAFSDEFDKCSCFSDFLKSEIWTHFSGPDQIFRPQTHWLNDPKTGRCLVNFIGKMENLNSVERNLSNFLFSQSDRLKFGCLKALFHKSVEGQTSPFPGRTYPTGSVTGTPRSV
jgi:hypothetical protein